MERLTDRKLSSYMDSLKKDLTLTDISGVTVSFRVGKKTSCIFYLRKSINGKQQRFKLGTFPALSIAEAREEYLRVLNRIQRNLPIVDKDKEHDLTLGDLWDEFTKRKFQSISQGTQRNYLGLWKNLLGQYAKLPISMINVQWVDEHFYNNFETATNKTTILKSVSALSNMMRYAAAKGYLPFDPLSTLQLIAPKYKSRHQTSFEYETMEQDMKDLFKAFYERHPLQAFGSLLFLFVTLLRCNEALGINLSDIGEDSDYRYAIVKTKTWETFKVPFTRQADILINWFAGQARNTDRILLNGTSPMLRHALYERLRTIGYQDKLTLHGIRSLGRQFMAQQDNIKESIAELCLAHRIGDETEQAYNRGTYIKKRLEAMQIWCDFVEKCLPNGLTFSTLFDMGTGKE